MQRISGYSIQKSLEHPRRGVEHHLAVHDASSAEVLITRYTDGELDHQHARLQRDRDALEMARGSGVPRVVEVLRDLEPPALVIERAPGRSLRHVVDEAPLPLESFLELAIQLAEILERVHDAGWIQCHLTPDTITLEPESNQAYLVDWSSARALGSVDTRARAHASFEASTLAYISPEQTGRMARGVDSRSDLYATGAVLYFALTGDPPFELDDPLALIHAHMARTPVSPLERRAELPPTLARIVQKLLQKEPSDRYQTAAALGRDLRECQAQLSRTGQIADELPLGTADIPMRPMFSTRLYGRDAEVRELEGAYARIQQDSAELVVLTGPPGVGKSALIQELRALISETGGYLVQGKFDLYRQDIPYSGLIAALEALTHQILGESEARLDHWRRTLAGALGKLARVMIDLVPDLEILLPDSPRVPKLGPKETQARLIYAFQRLVRACGQPDHPLVLFIDDLQWADPGSRSVLDALLSRSRGTSLLVVITCRNEHEPESLPVEKLANELQHKGVQVTRLEIEPLGLEAATEMLADALQREPGDVRRLTERVAAKTGRNPLWIQQFISHVHDLGLITYAPPHGWNWDEQAIQAADVPEGAVGLLVAKLERLPVRSRALIQFASCVGDEFEIDLLCELTGDPRDAIEPPLFELAKEGLLAPSSQGFRFVHDRIREAAQALLSDEQRARLHHRTGRHLLERAPLAVFTERIFELTDHFNRSLDHLSEDERCKVIELNVIAGSRALDAGASQTAAAYLAVGRRLLQPRDWESGAELVYRLLIHSADAAFQTREFDLAIELLDELDRHPLEHMQSASVAARRIACLVPMQPEAAFARTLKELRRFGVRVPRRVGYLRARLSIEYTNWRMARFVDADGWTHAPPPQNSDWAAPILITGAGGAALIRGGGLMFACVTTSRSLLLFRKHGPLPGMTLSLAAFAAMLSSLRMRIKLRDVQRYIDATLNMAARLPTPIDVRSRFSLHCFTLPYLKPRRELLQPLQEIALSAFELGDPEYGLYTTGHRAFSLALCGCPIDEVVEAFRRLIEEYRLGAVGLPLRACGDAYDVLRDANAAQSSWTGTPASIEVGLEAELSGDASVAFHWVIVLCHLGHFERASEFLPRLTVQSFRINPVAGLDHLFYSTLCRSALAAKLGGLRRRQLSMRLRASLWSVRGRILPSADFVHIPTSIQAECARLEGRTAAAVTLYHEAAKLAADRKYIHHAALLHARRADLLRAGRRDMEARKAFQQAHDLYKAWGASGLVRRLEASLRE